MSTNSTGPPEHISFKHCTEVGPLCPVSATVLGYYPNLGVNAFLAAAFGLCIIGLVGTGIWKRTWGYSAALTAGCILEFAGEYFPHFACGQCLARNAILNAFPTND